MGLTKSNKLKKHWGCLEKNVPRLPAWLFHSLKKAVENPKGNVEKLSPKESVEGAQTVLREGVSPPPPICLTALRFFLGLYLNLLRCWLQPETDFVKFSSKFDHENLNNSRTIKLHNK